MQKLHSVDKNPKIVKARLCTKVMGRVENYLIAELNLKVITDRGTDRLNHVSKNCHCVECTIC